MGTGAELGPRSLIVVPGGGSGERVQEDPFCSLEPAREPVLAPRRPGTGVAALLEGPGRPGGVQRSGKASGAGSAVPRGFRSAVGDGGADVKRTAVRCRKLPGATELPGQ